MEVEEDNRRKINMSVEMMEKDYLGAMASYKLYRLIAPQYKAAANLQTEIPLVVLTQTNLEEFLTTAFMGQIMQRFGVNSQDIPPITIANTEQFKGHQAWLVFYLEPIRTHTESPFKRYVGETRHYGLEVKIGYDSGAETTIISYSAARNILGKLSRITEPFTGYSVTYDRDEILPTLAPAMKNHERTRKAVLRIFTNSGIDSQTAEELSKIYDLVMALAGIHPGPDRKAYGRLTHSAQYYEEQGKPRIIPKANPFSYLRVFLEAMTYSLTHSILTIRESVRQLAEYKSPDHKAALLAANNPMVAKIVKVQDGRIEVRAKIFAQNRKTKFRNNNEYEEYHEKFEFDAFPILPSERRILNPYVAFLLKITIDTINRRGTGPKIGQTTTIPIVMNDNDNFVQDLKELITKILNELQTKLSAITIPQKIYEAKSTIIEKLMETYKTEQDPWKRIILSNLIDSIYFNRDILDLTIGFIRGNANNEQETIVNAILDTIVPRYILVPRTQGDDLETGPLTETVETEDEDTSSLIDSLDDSVLVDKHDYVPPTSQMESIKRIIDYEKTHSRGEDAVIDILFNMDRRTNPWLKTVSEIINGPNALRDRTAYTSPSINALLAPPRHPYRTPHVQYKKGESILRFPVAFAPIHSLASNPGAIAYLYRILRYSETKQDDFLEELGLEEDVSSIIKAYLPFVETARQEEIRLLPRLESFTDRWNENEPLDVDQSKELDHRPDIITILLSIIATEYPVVKNHLQDESFVWGLAKAIVDFMYAWNEINREIILGDPQRYMSSFIYASTIAGNQSENNLIQRIFSNILPLKFQYASGSRDGKFKLDNALWTTMVFYSFLNDATRIVPMIGMVFRAPVIYDSSYFPVYVASWSYPYTMPPYPESIKSMAGDVDGDTVRTLVVPDQDLKSKDELSELMREIEDRYRQYRDGFNLSQPLGRQEQNAQRRNAVPETELTAYTALTLNMVSGITAVPQSGPAIFVMTSNPQEWKIERNGQSLSVFLEPNIRFKPRIDYQNQNARYIIWEPTEYPETRAVIPQIRFTAPYDLQTQSAEHKKIETVLGLEKPAPIDPISTRTPDQFESPFRYYGTVIRVQREGKQTEWYTTLAHVVFLAQLVGMYEDDTTKQAVMDAIYKAARHNKVNFFATTTDRIAPISSESVNEFFLELRTQLEQNFGKRSVEFWRVWDALMISYQEMTTNPFNNPIIGDVEEIVKKAKLPNTPQLASTHPKAAKIKEMSEMLGQVTVDAMVTVARMWLLSVNQWRNLVSERAGRQDRPYRLSELVEKPSLADYADLPASPVFSVYYITEDVEGEGKRMIVPILGKVKIRDTEYEVYVDLASESVIRRKTENGQVSLEKLFSLNEPDSFDISKVYLKPEISFAFTDVVSAMAPEISLDELKYRDGIPLLSYLEYEGYQKVSHQSIMTKFQSWAETIGALASMLFNQRLYEELPDVAAAISPFAMLMRCADLLSNAVNLKRFVAAAKATATLKPTTTLVKADDRERYLLGELQDSPIIKQIVKLGITSQTTILAGNQNLTITRKLPISETIKAHLKQLVGTISNTIRTVFSVLPKSTQKNCTPTNEERTQYVPSKLGLLPTIDPQPIETVKTMLSNDSYLKFIRERLLYQAGDLRLFVSTEQKIGEIVIIAQKTTTQQGQSVVETVIRSVPIDKPQNLDVEEKTVSEILEDSEMWPAFVSSIRDAISQVETMQKQENLENVRVVQIILYHRSPLRCLYRKGGRKTETLEICEMCLGGKESGVTTADAQAPIDAAKAYIAALNPTETFVLEKSKIDWAGSIGYLMGRGTHPISKMRTESIISPLRVFFSRVWKRSINQAPTEITPPGLDDAQSSQRQTQSSQRTFTAQQIQKMQHKIRKHIVSLEGVLEDFQDAVRIYVPSAYNKADDIVWLINQHEQLTRIDQQNLYARREYNYIVRDENGQNHSLLPSSIVFIVDTEAERDFLREFLTGKLTQANLWEQRIVSLEEHFKGKETLKHTIISTLQTNNIVPHLLRGVTGIENYIIGALLSDATMEYIPYERTPTSIYKRGLHRSLANPWFYISRSTDKTATSYREIYMDQYHSIISGVVQRVMERLKRRLRLEEKDPNYKRHQESATAAVFLRTLGYHTKMRNDRDAFKHIIKHIETALPELSIETWTYSYPLNREGVRGLHVTLATIGDWSRRIGNDPPTPIEVSPEKFVDNPPGELGILELVFGTMPPTTRTPGSYPLNAPVAKN
jgi:hypothetical protein